MGMTRERITFAFDPRDMLLSRHIGFSFVRAAVACAILERILSSESSSEPIASKYFQACNTSKILSFNRNFPPDAIGAVCH